MLALLVPGVAMGAGGAAAAASTSQIPLVGAG